MMLICRFFFNELSVIFLISSIFWISLAHGIKVCIPSEAASGSSAVLTGLWAPASGKSLAFEADNFSHSKVLLLSSSSNKNKIIVECKATFYSAPKQLPTVFSGRCLLLPWKPLDSWRNVCLCCAGSWCDLLEPRGQILLSSGEMRQSLMNPSEGWCVLSWFGFAELFREGRSRMQTVNMLMSGSTHRIKHCWAALCVPVLCPPCTGCCSNAQSTGTLNHLVLEPCWVLTHRIFFFRELWFLNLY